MQLERLQHAHQRVDPESPDLAGAMPDRG